MLIVACINASYNFRDRQDALEQRFSSFSVTDGLWKDIADMRSGVEIETTAMAHNKLRMNYDW